MDSNIKSSKKKSKRRYFSDSNIIIRKSNKSKILKRNKYFSNNNLYKIYKNKNVTPHDNLGKFNNKVQIRNVNYSLGSSLGNLGNYNI